MDPIAFWLDRPFDPHRPVKRGGRRASRGITIRYRGSIGRSTVKALIVLLLLAVMANVVGERSGQDLGANEISRAAGPAGTLR